MATLIERLRSRADEIDRAVARDKDDRDGGSFGEIELMREAAIALEALGAGSNAALPAIARRRVLEREIAAALRELETL